MPTPRRVGRCKALYVSDGTPCQELATSRNGVFCPPHSRQCHGLYMGYKSCNSQLHDLSKSRPKYLAGLSTPLLHENFSAVTDEKVCTEIHDHLTQQRQLLERVIRTRQLHHRHFYSQDNDYGHVTYLRQLQNQDLSVTKALERIELRIFEILLRNSLLLSQPDTMQMNPGLKRDPVGCLVGDEDGVQVGLLTTLWRMGLAFGLVIAITWAVRRLSWRSEIEMCKNGVAKVLEILRG